MEGTIIIRGGSAAMQDGRAKDVCDAKDSEALIGIEAKCRFSGITDKARILSSILDAFSRDPMERMLITISFRMLEEMHIASEDKDREQIVFPGDESSPDGFSDVGIMKSLFDKLQRED